MGEIILLDCAACGRASGRIVKGMCPRCYMKSWNQSPGGRAARERKYEGNRSKRVPRTAEQIAAGVPPSRNESRLGSAASWYGSESKVPPAVQRRIFELYSQGVDAPEIASDVRVHAETVRRIIQRGVLSPKHVAPYRCGGCGNKVCALPCFICESRRVHANSRNLGQLVG